MVPPVPSQKTKVKDEGQRAAVAAKLANMPVGRNWGKSNSANLQNNAVTQTAAAHLLNVSPRTVADAAKVKAESPQLFEAIEKGDIAPVSP